METRKDIDTKEDEKEQIRLMMLGVFEPDIYTHSTKHGEFNSNSKDDNPNSLHNSIAIRQEP